MLKVGHLPDDEIDAELLEGAIATIKRDHKRAKDAAADKAVHYGLS